MSEPESKTPDVDPAAKIKAELAAFRSQREAKTAPVRAASEVERLRLELADEIALAKAEDEHGATNVRGVRTASGVVIVKRANHLVFKRYIDRAKFGTKEQEELIAPCLVHPDPDAFDRYVALEPWKLQAVAGAIGVLAGFSQDDLAGK